MKRIVRISLFFVCIIFFLTLTGCKKKYNVVFFDSEKNVVLEEKIKKGKKINEPETPIKEGYNFLGWYDEGEKWDFSSNKVDGDLKLHQKWETISYNITYDLNGGTLEKTNPSNYTIEDSITLNNPKRENYEFIGWTISDSDTPKINISFNGETGDKYYKANYKEKEFTIKLVSNGGSNVENVKYKISDTTIYLGEPTREGYKFIGWYDEYGYPAEIYEYRDYVFYAKWELEQYKITFDSEHSEYFTVENKDFVLYEPVRIGYKFLGWYENDVLVESLEYRNYDLVARWEIREYILTFNENGGSDVADVKYTINDTEIYVEEPIREGYKFIGWYDEKSGLPIEYCYIGDYSFDDYTFNAKWRIEYYKITFESAGGSYINSTSFTIEDTSALLNQPIREGYKFIGWYENDILVEDLECRDYNLVAKWEIEYYKITFDSAGGSLVEDIEFTVKDQVVLEEPVCQGLKFIGWYENDTLITILECRDYELVAKWKKLEIDIEIYEENSRMYVNLGRYPQTLVTDKNLIKELTKIKTTNEKGYIEYNGEEYKREAADPYYIDDEFHDGSPINDNEIYYFKVEPIRWIVISKNDGTYQLLSQNVLDTKKFYNDYYDRYVNGTTVHPNNYEYSNIRAWLNGYDGSSYDVNNYENKGFLNIAFTEDEQLFINQTFINNSASSTGYNGNIYYCNNTYDKIYLLSAVEADIYDYMYSNNFKYVSDYARAVGCTSYYSSNYKEWQGPWWLRSPESVDRYCACTQGVSEEAYDQVAKNGFGVRVALNITIDISSYNQVVFHDYNKPAVKISYVEPGKNAIAPTLNERTGYEFVGWDKDFSNVTENIKVYAVYSANKYVVTLDVNSGDLLEEDVIEIKYNSIFDITPTKLGYTFVGWYDENNNIVPLGNWVLTSNVSLKAEWELGVYNIIYDLNGGETKGPTKFTMNDIITLKEATKEGYTFIGWTNEEITEPQLNVSFSNKTSDINFVANYKVNSYVLTLDVNGGDHLEEDVIEIEYDSIFDITPNKDGYDFIGWYNESRDLVELGNWKIAENVVLKAKWVDSIYCYREENGIRYINLGKYPQTKVDDEEIITELSKINTKNSRGYVENNNEEYYKQAYYVSNPDAFFGFDIFYNYYKVEPIRWIILSESKDCFTLLSEIVLEIKEYCSSTTDRKIKDDYSYSGYEYVSASNYEYSEIRAWLNSYDGSNYSVDNYKSKGFYDVVFNETEKSMIKKMNVDNSPESTGLTYNKASCDDTYDYVYLFSVQDVINTNYGFSSSKYFCDDNRKVEISDYVSSLGKNKGWLLRSPSEIAYNEIYCVDSEGYIKTGKVNIEYGIRPAMTIVIE